MHYRDFFNILSWSMFRSARMCPASATSPTWTSGCSPAWSSSSPASWSSSWWRLSTRRGTRNGGRWWVTVNLGILFTFSLYDWRLTGETKTIIFTAVQFLSKYVIPSANFVFQSPTYRRLLYIDVEISCLFFVFMTAGHLIKDPSWDWFRL